MPNKYKSAVLTWSFVEVGFYFVFNMGRTYATDSKRTKIFHRFTVHGFPIACGIGNIILFLIYR